MKHNKYNIIINIFILILLSLNLLGIIFLVGQAYYAEDVVERKIIYVHIHQEKTEKDIETETKTKTNTKPKIQTPSRSSGQEFIITAYDNSLESQGKWVDQTATGFNLKGHSLESAKCIAVDPTIIPLGSKVQLIFDDEYKHLNDVYIARDTGGAIKGKRIDLFMGDGVDKKIVNDFGKRKVKVIILE